MATNLPLLYPAGRYGTSVMRDVPCVLDRILHIDVHGLAARRGRRIFGEPDHLSRVAAALSDLRDRSADLCPGRTRARQILVNAQRCAMSMR